MQELRQAACRGTGVRGEKPPSVRQLRQLVRDKPFQWRLHRFAPAFPFVEGEIEQDFRQILVVLPASEPDPVHRDRQNPIRKTDNACAVVIEFLFRRSRIRQRMLRTPCASAVRRFRQHDPRIRPVPVVRALGKYTDQFSRFRPNHVRPRFIPLRIVADAEFLYPHFSSFSLPPEREVYRSAFKKTMIKK